VLVTRKVPENGAGVAVPGAIGMKCPLCSGEFGVVRAEVRSFAVSQTRVAPGAER
jgi:hypothetical protein